MRYSASLFCLVGVFSGIQGIAFGGVALTASGPEHVVDDTAPKPTKNPLTMNLRKRQAYLGQETCGWVDGDYGTLGKLSPATLEHLLTCASPVNDLSRGLDMHALQICSGRNGWMLQWLRFPRLRLVQFMHRRRGIRSWQMRLELHNGRLC